MSDEDGDLLPGEFFLFYDAEPDGVMDDAAFETGRYLAAEVDPDVGEGSCSTEELILPLDIVPADLDVIDYCTGYGWRPSSSSLSIPGIRPFISGA